MESEGERSESRSTPNVTPKERGVTLAEKESVLLPNDATLFLSLTVIWQRGRGKRGVWVEPLLRFCAQVALNFHYWPSSGSNGVILGW